MVQLAEPPPYKVKYLNLNARDIYNRAGKYDWRDPPEKIAELQQYFEEEDKKRDLYFTRLEKSILEKGMVDPITVVSGFMTGWMYDELPDWVKKDLLVCDRWGGSRLRLAQKYDWRINCIVSDFDNRFPNAPILRTISEIESKFGNKPVKIEMHKYGVIITPNKLTH